MLRSAVRSTRRACATHAAQKQQLRRLSQTPARAALRANPQSASPLASQAMLLDRFGKQHRFDYHHRDGSSSQALAYWKAALVASGVCIASSVSDDSVAHAASSKGSGSGGDKSASDLFEELKQKLQELSGESLESLQKLVPDEYKDIPKQVNDFLASGKGGQISWGFAMGVCSGFALKKVSKVGAIALGALFVLMQCASYSGYIDVNYQKLERDVMDLLDINKDGQFDSKDVDAVYQQVMKVLEFSLPAGSGYAVGFLIGFRAG